MATVYRSGGEATEQAREEERGGWRWEVGAEADEEAMEVVEVWEQGRGHDVVSSSEAREVLDISDCRRKLTSSLKPFAFTLEERRPRRLLRLESSRRRAVTATVLVFGR